MVVRVNYAGAWPPEQAAEAPLEGATDRFVVRGIVTKLVGDAQLLRADRSSGALAFNAGAASVRTCAAVTVAVDAACAAPDEAAALELLAAANARATDDESPTLYVAASRLAALAAADASGGGAALAVGDVVRANVLAAAAPFTNDLVVERKAPRDVAPARGAAVDVDGSGFAARVFAAKANAPPPPPPGGDDAAVADDEWDD